MTSGNAPLAADYIVEQLVGLGVRHVFGVGGANIEDLFSAVQRRRPEIRVVLCKHEHAAGTAADAYARLSGLGVVLVTSGGGAMNLVHALAEARASHARVLAIVGEPPTFLQGHGAFQDTSGKGQSVDARAVFQAVSERAFRVDGAEDLAAGLDAVRRAWLGPTAGPVVLLLAKDIQRAVVAGELRAWTPPVALSPPSAEDVQRALGWLTTRPVLLIAGSEVARAGAQRELAAIAESLDATVATTPDGRDAFDNESPRFLGVAGAMGHAGVSRALASAELVVAVGTRLPLLARQGLEPLLREKKLLCVGRAPTFVTGADSLHLAGDLLGALRELARELGGAPAAGRAAGAVAEKAHASASADSARLTAANVLELLERVVSEQSIVLVDAGNTGASAVHGLRAPRAGRWLMAMGMAGMGYTFGAATGAACATGKRCFVVAGDGAFFMNGMEIHTAVEHALPITYVLLNNQAHGMCLVRERLLLDENAGYNAFRESHLGAGLAAMFPGLAAADCATRGELQALLARSRSVQGPFVIAAELDEVEVPPFAAFRERQPVPATVAREVTRA